MQEEIDKSRKVIEQSLEDFAASLPLDFAASLKKNGKLRNDYRNMVKKASEEFLNLADQEASGLATLEEKLTVYKDYAKKAVEARNSLMEISRDKITQGGKLLSLIKKEKGLTLPELLERYSNKQFQKAYAELAFEEQFSVMGSIIEASGRTNALFNKVAKFGGQAMLGLFVVTLGISLYASLTSENPLKETARTIVGLGFGVAGTVVATELLAGVAVCGGPIGALIAVVIEGAVGLVLTLAGENLVDLLYYAFFPASTPGPGPPKLHFLKNLYSPSGIPPLDYRPIAPGPPGLGKSISFGPPKAHGH